MDKKRILKYIAVSIALVAICVLIIVFNKFQFNVNYSKNVRIELDLDGTFEIGEIINITNEVFNGDVAIVRSAGDFGNVIAITVKDSTDEQNEALIAKINEKYEKNFTVDDLKLYYNSNVKGIDLIKPYIVPCIIAGALILVFFALRYRKLGILRTLASVIITAGGTILLYMALTSIFKMEVNEVTIASGLAIEIFCLMYMAVTYEKALKDK